MRRHAWICATLIFTSVLTHCRVISADTPADHGANAVAAFEVLQNEFYNSSTGLWGGAWWNSASCVTTLANLQAVNGKLWWLTDPIFSNTFERAQKQSFMLRKRDFSIESPPLVAMPDKRAAILAPEEAPPLGSPQADPPNYAPEDFVNDFWDDSGWWALAWVDVYDRTKEQRYLDEAVHIWQQMAFKGANATCGGMYWNTQKVRQVAITDEIFLSLSAHLATRTANGNYYAAWAFKHWAWFANSGLIRPGGLVVDRLDDTTCQPITNGPSFSYNQGVILTGLLELHRINPQDTTYIAWANYIARAAITALSNQNGILTEWGTGGRPISGGDLPTFKGVFIRSLQKLQQATGDKAYAQFIQRNADSVWNADRSAQNGTLGNVWDHYYAQTRPQGHCAGMDALIAAAAIDTPTGS